MLELIDLESDRVVAFRIEGKIVDEDFEKVVAAIKERFATHEKLRIYAEIPVFEGISIGAFMRDLKFAAGHWRRFDKEAVVTDQPWLQKATELMGNLLPNFEVRAFSVTQTDAARRWIVE